MNMKDLQQATAGVIANDEVKIKLPIVLSMQDYHSIDYICDLLKLLSGQQIEAEEISGPSNAVLYYGIFYIGNMPSKQERKALLKKAVYIA